MFKNVILTSEEPNKYADVEVECLVVDDMKEFVTSYVKYKLKAGKKPIYARKTALVEARLGNIGEEADTRPRVERNGKIYTIGETKGRVKVEGSMIVKNPDKEEYIVKPDKFSSKYASTSTPGIYKPISQNVKLIELDQDIAFKAPWGEEMLGIKGAYLNIDNMDDVYAIQNEAFKKTYTISESESEMQ